MGVNISKIIKVPWAAWREPEYLDLAFPNSWEVTKCQMNGAEAQELSDDAIRESILNPIGVPRLSDLAKGKEKVVTKILIIN